MTAPAAGSLREHQRAATRSFIRKAARACFLREGAGNVSMEMVAAEAGIRRATLYLYYPGKNALLLDLLDRGLRATDRIYERLRDLPEVDFGTVRAWLAGYLDEVMQHSATVDLFRSEILPSDELHEIVGDHISRTIALLGARFGGFDLSRPDRARRAIRAELAIREVESFCSEARRADYPLDRDLALDIVAERLLAMLEE